MKRILVVDDEAPNRMMISRYLREMGHQPVQAANGREALELLETDSAFDLLITDVMMPELDGRDLVRRMRFREDLRDIPVLIMSAYVGPREIWDLLQNGATYFLAKPLHVADLGEYVQRALGQRTKGAKP